jgi:hypothetical protein
VSARESEPCGGLALLNPKRRKKNVCGSGSSHVPGRLRLKLSWRLALSAATRREEMLLVERGI